MWYARINFCKIKGCVSNPYSSNFFCFLKKKKKGAALLLINAGWSLKTSKRPEEGLAPSQGHSSIVLQLIPGRSITFRLSLSGWSLCGALRLSLISAPPFLISLHFNGGRVILSGWRWQRLRATLRRWSAAATGQCENCDTGEGQQTSAQIS